MPSTAVLTEYTIWGWLVGAVVSILVLVFIAGGDPPDDIL